MNDILLLNDSKELNLKDISTYSDREYSSTKRLLFKFKSNRLTSRKCTICPKLFEIFYEPVVDEITIKDLSYMKGKDLSYMKGKDLSYMNNNFLIKCRIPFLIRSRIPFSITTKI